MRPEHNGPGNGSLEILVSLRVRTWLSSMRPEHNGPGNSHCQPRASIWSTPASMRPEHNGRGNNGSARVSAISSASMRPEHNGPGNRFAHARRYSLIASMRPQHNGRGNLKLLFLWTSPHGFNEARAQWPGKSASPRGPEIVASMRPEHNGRGNNQPRTKPIFTPLQ